jgi:hypothetical protein
MGVEKQLFQKRFEKREDLLSTIQAIKELDDCEFVVAHYKDRSSTDSKGADLSSTHDVYHINGATVKLHHNVSVTQTMLGHYLNVIVYGTPSEDLSEWLGKTFRE